MTKHRAVPPQRKDALHLSADVILFDDIYPVRTQAVDRFAVSNYFTPGDKSGVVLHSIHLSFRKTFRNRIEESIPASTILVRRLLNPARTPEILSGLGSIAEIFLGELWQLLTTQGHGGIGALSTSRAANLAYVRNEENRLIEVNVDWCGGGWLVAASSTKCRTEWPANTRVLSRCMS